MIPAQSARKTVAAGRAFFMRISDTFICGNDVGSLARVYSGACVSFFLETEVRVALCYHFCMSQPVKLSDALVLDARLAGEVQERSIAGQVEFWAKLGQSIDLLLTGQQRTTLLRGGEKRTLSDALASVDSPEGRERLKAYLDSQPYPHFEAHPRQSGLLLRIEGNGTRTVGRFVNRNFVMVEIEPESDAISDPRSQASSDVQSAVKKRVKLRSTRA